MQILYRFLHAYQILLLCFEDLKQISTGSIYDDNFFWWFLQVALKLEKVDPTFSSFSQCQSLSSVATDNKKQFQCVNKTGPLFLEFD